MHFANFFVGGCDRGLSYEVLTRGFVSARGDRSMPALHFANTESAGRDGAAQNTAIRLQITTKARKDPIYGLIADDRTRDRALRHITLTGAARFVQRPL